MSDDDWRDFGRLYAELDIVCRKQDESPELESQLEADAESIRDKLDVYWYRMTAAEQDRARMLSEEICR